MTRHAYERFCRRDARVVARTERPLIASALWLTMLVFLAVFALALATHPALANVPAAGPDSLHALQLATRVHAQQVGEGVCLDGILDETVWQQPSAAPLIQNDPDNGCPPRQRTDWWVAYDQDALYVAARMYDACPDSISCGTGRRDTWPSSDWVYLNLDTFNDDRSGYSFSFTPTGTMGDAVIYNDGWTDSSWDGIWECATQVDTQGWTAEVRIPFSQLRFPNCDDQTWGINFSRRTLRYQERDELFHRPRGEAGYVGRFPDLLGICGIRPSRQIEVLAYAAGKAEYLNVDAEDPFRDGSDYWGDLGADFTVGLSSDLMLNATVNPDFGQVEVDPAVVNLSASETYYGERRPFFVEDASTFRFGNEGTNNNWNFNWMDPMLLYSRRIGRAPHLSLGDRDYADVPERTTILGAGKVGGKLGGMNVGFLSAVTSREHAELDLAGERRAQLVEPLTSYTVLRAKTTRSEGRQGLGVMATGTWRDLPDARSRQELARSAFSGGVDGWTRLDGAGIWALKGHLSASQVAGDEAVIADLQNASTRYYQRPETGHLHYDPTRTSLSGWAGRVMLNRESGNLTMNTALGAISPGYEINDLGFQTRADLINFHFAAGYRWMEPTRTLRYRGFSFAGFGAWDYGGTPLSRGTTLFWNLDFTNYWWASGNVFYYPERNTRNTRGGPLIRLPEEASAEVDVGTDSRKMVSFEMGFNRGHSAAFTNAGGRFDLVVRPRESLKITLGPRYSWYLDHWGWATKVDDPLMEATYGTRYIYCDLEYKQASMVTRVDWAFTPKLTLQTYVQPLIATGEYSDFKEFARPRTFDFNHYGADQGSTLEYDADGDVYQVDPDGEGPAEAFSFSNPDFNFKSLKVNVVLRWEYRPGSTFYLVWQQGRQDYSHPGDFELGRDARALLDAESENIIMAKVTTWWDL